MWNWIVENPATLGRWFGTALGAGLTLWLGYRVGRKHGREETKR